MGFFNALRNVPWKQYQGTQWRLNFNRSGLNFNAASHLTLMAQPQFEDVLYDNPILWVCQLAEHALSKCLDRLGNSS